MSSLNAKSNRSKHQALIISDNGEKAWVVLVNRVTGGCDGLQEYVHSIGLNN
jgi:hypothetical protein